MAADKGDYDRVINKKETPHVVTASDNKVAKVAKEQFNKYQGTFKKLAKN